MMQAPLASSVKVVFAGFSEQTQVYIFVTSFSFFLDSVLTLSPSLSLSLALFPFCSQPLSDPSSAASPHRYS